MMSNLSEKDQRTLRFGGYAAAGILALMIGIFPAIDYLDGLNAQIDKKQKELREITERVSGASQSRRQMTTLAQAATVHTEPEALNQQTALMLQQVERLPSYRGLTVRRLEGLPLREDEEFYRSGVSLQFSGNLTNLHRFLDEMEASRPALKVERLTVAADQNEATRIEGQMVISGYAVVTGGGKKG